MLRKSYSPSSPTLSPVARPRVLEIPSALPSSPSLPCYPRPADRSPSPSSVVPGPGALGTSGPMATGQPASVSGVQGFWGGGIAVRETMFEFGVLVTNDSSLAEPPALARSSSWPSPAHYGSGGTVRQIRVRRFFARRQGFANPDQAPGSSMSAPDGFANPDQAQAPRSFMLALEGTVKPDEVPLSVLVRRAPPLQSRAPPSEASSASAARAKGIFAERMRQRRALRAAQRDRGGGGGWAQGGLLPT